MARCARIAVLIALMMIPFSLPAQESPFLPQATYDKLVNEISGDIAYDSLRSLVMYHAPSAGSDGFEQEAQWVAARAKANGLEDVTYIALPAWRGSPKEPSFNWTVKAGELWLVEPEMKKLGDVRETPVHVADNSPTADITAELVDVGEGTQESDYAGKDVAGKIVLAYGHPNAVKKLACWDRGAVGIVTYYSSRVSSWTDFPDQVAWVRMGPSQEGEKPVPPVFVVSPRTGLGLSRAIAGKGGAYHFAPGSDGKDTKPNFKVHLKINAEVTQPERSGIVEGIIRGTTYHDQAIVLTAHMQEEKTSANDDRSGCANLLEIARALSAMIADGRLPRPKRDIRFWWTDEIFGEYEYFAQYPAERTRIIANINQDMVGAKQSLGGRVQYISRTPWSRWHFINDVMESIVDSLVKGNNAYIVAWQNGRPAPYSRPVFAGLGTREPYNAKVVPFYDSTDHATFNDGAIGIPGLSLTNWPDEYIHSTDDDLWQIDSTQLKRNAVAVTATALYLANLSEADVPKLAAVIAGEARERISHDLATGLSHLAEASPEQRHTAHAEAVNLLNQSVEREIIGIESIRRFADPNARKLLDSLISDLRLTGSNHRGRIDEWMAVLGEKKTSIVISEKEKELSLKVPKTVGTTEELLHARQRVEGPKGLHGLMSYEALNFVDGQRSILDIQRMVQAEALSAGEWYYGTVTVDAIESLFKSAEKEKAVEIVTKPDEGSSPASKSEK
jgi:hypothetical protein